MVEGTGEEVVVSLEGVVLIPIEVVRIVGPIQAEAPTCPRMQLAQKGNLTKQL